MISKDKSKAARIPAAKLEQVAATLRLLAHPMRLRVVEALDALGEAPVHALTARVGMAPAALSQHLNQMKRAGLVRSARRGREVWYSVADPRALTVLACIRGRGGR